MAGDATLFAREDYVEEAWRIVDPVLQKVTPVYPYEPNSWGPNEMDRVTPPGGWQNPVVCTRDFNRGWPGCVNFRRGEAGIEEEMNIAVFPDGESTARGCKVCCRGSRRRSRCPWSVRDGRQRRSNPFREVQ
jgi:hypothetical protein